MDKPPEIKLDVPTREILVKLISDSPPLGMRGAPALHVFHRDLYFDARDQTLERRGICCRLRTRSDDTRVLSLEIRAASSRQVHEQVVREVDFAPSSIPIGWSPPSSWRRRDTGGASAAAYCRFPDSSLCTTS
jgi:hypothetical protein